MTRPIDASEPIMPEFVRRSPESPEIWLVQLFGALVLHAVLLFGVRLMWAEIAVEEPQAGTIDFVEVGTVDQVNETADQSTKAEGVAPTQPAPIAQQQQTTLQPPEPIAPVPPQQTPSPEPVVSPSPIVAPSPRPNERPQPQTSPTPSTRSMPNQPTPTASPSKSPSPITSPTNSPESPNPTLPQPKPIGPITPIDDPDPKGTKTSAGAVIGEYQQISVPAKDLKRSVLQLKEGTLTLPLATDSSWQRGESFLVEVLMVLPNPVKVADFQAKPKPGSIEFRQVLSANVPVEATKQMELQGLVQQMLSQATFAVQLDTGLDVEPEESAWLVQVQINVI